MNFNFNFILNNLLVLFIYNIKEIIYTVFNLQNILLYSFFSNLHFIYINQCKLFTFLTNLFSNIYYFLVLYCLNILIKISDLILKFMLILLIIHYKICKRV